MKKFICFILGLVIGAWGTFLYFEDVNISDVVSDIREALSDSEEGSFSEETAYKESEDHEPEKEEIKITPHFNSCALLGDDIGFPMPPEDMIDPDREGDYVLYDMQENGKGVLMNYYGIGMQTVLADIFVTSDYGKSWEAVERKASFLSGDLDVIYIGDTIVIVNSNGA